MVSSNNPEKKKAFLEMRKKQLLEGKQNTIQKSIDAIKLNDITKVNLSSRNGAFYQKQIIEFYGQQAYDEEMKKRSELRKKKYRELKKTRSKIHLDKPHYDVPKELSQNTWNIRKKRISEIGLDAYREEQLKKRKEYQKLYILKNKEKRKEYNKRSKDLILKQSKRYRTKNKEKIYFKKREQYQFDEEFRNKVKKYNQKNSKKNTEAKKLAGKNFTYTKEEKEKIINGTFFNEKAKENRMKKLKVVQTKEKDPVLDFLKKKNYDETLSVLSKIELIFKDSFIIDFKSNSIFSMDCKCFYGVHLKNNNIFDLLIKDENGYTFGIVGKNVIEKTNEKRAIVKKVSFLKWEEVEIFAKALQKGF